MHAGVGAGGDHDALVAPLVLPRLRSRLSGDSARLRRRPRTLAACVWEASSGLACMRRPPQRACWQGRRGCAGAGGAAGETSHAQGG
jgi:hypothetical protein